MSEINTNYSDFSPMLYKGDRLLYVSTKKNRENTGWGVKQGVKNQYTDLFVANGRIPAAPFIGTGDSDPNYLYINNGDTTFTQSQISVNTKDKGRGMAYSDYDKDGDLDLVVVVLKGSASANPKTTFYENELNPNGSDS